MALPLLGFLSTLVKPVTELIDSMHTSDEEKAAAKLKAIELLQQKEDELIKNQSKIIEAEAKSRHWLTAAWRPCLMFTFILLIINNYVAAPYINLFFDKDIMLTLPPKMWSLLQIGVGGYIVGRSAEKMEIFKRK